MNLGIVCKCEGLLTRGPVLTICTRCRKTYPNKDLEVILKLLRVANYEASSPDQKPPTEDEKHTAVTLAARRLIALGLKVMDIDELTPQPSPPPPPQPTYRPPVPTYGSTTNTTATGYYGTSMGYVDINFGGFIFRVRGYTV
jgi:hypothetical protein